MPLFNKAPYVAKAIHGVLSQTYSDFELVVMDDGSSDDSFETAQDTIRGYGNCHIYQQQNAGAGVARNNAVNLSRGEYLCFLDADDWWEPTFLEKMNGLILGYPEARIFGTNYYYVKNGRRRVCVANAETGYINYCQVYAETLQMPLWTGAVCIPRSVFDEFGGFRPHIKIGEDFDLWIKVALKYKVAFLNEPQAFYNQDSDAAWRLVGKLHAPKAHMLWNLDYLEQEERTNPDYKRLIDALRTNGLLRYYLSPQYRDVAKQELKKVDWEKQPQRVSSLYKTPIGCLIVQRRLRLMGSIVKQRIISLKRFLFG